MIFKIYAMNYRFILILGLALCLGVSACAWNPKKGKVEKPICAEWLMPDSTAYNKLGKRLTTILFAPQTVKCYHLIGKEKIENGELAFEQNFVRDSLLATFSSNETSVLQYILLKQGENYESDTVRVMSPYLPILEFEFTKKKDKAHVIISLSDLTWTVIYDDKRQFNYNYSNEELIAQFCDFYLSKYKPTTK